MAVTLVPAGAEQTVTHVLAGSGSHVSPSLAAAPSAEAKSWWSELPNTLLDKGLLALVVAYAGLILNGALERLKSEESLSSGLTEIRLKKAGEMSEAAYVWESDVVASVGKLRRDVDKYPIGAEQADLVRKFAAADRARLVENGRKCSSTLASNRFWVGDSLYNDFNAFYSSVSQALEKIVDVNGLGAFQEAFDENRVSASQAMNAFIAEHIRMRAQWHAAAKKMP